MTVENKRVEVKEEKELRCPFSPDPNFLCQNCRLYQPFKFGGKEKICVFLRMND